MLALIQNHEHIVGGATDSIFPAVEEWLQDDGDRYKAFTRLRGRKSASKYRSLMDFLLCEVVPSMREPCFAFYDDKGPPLREIAKARELRAYESRMLLFLAIAYESFCQKRRMSWSLALELVEEIVGRAA